MLSAMSADLFIVFGSSLKVNPAYLIPMASNGKLIICNPEPTPFDSLAHLSIRGSIEDILKSLQTSLKISVPNFKVTREITILNRNNEITLCKDPKPSFVNHVKIVNFNIHL